MNIIDEPHKITKLEIKQTPKAKEGQMLTLVSRSILCDAPGSNYQHAYVVDPEAAFVECSRCKKQFNPISVLVDLCKEESQWMRNKEHYKERMEELSRRNKTKCDHCHKMTSISYLK